MAVYTEVSDAELEAFLADYDIGQAESFKGIAEGVENTNYVLTTDQRPVHRHALRKARRSDATCRSSSA